MRPVVIIASNDSIFAETLSKNLAHWGFKPHRQKDDQDDATEQEGDGDVVLFDIRELADEVFDLLGSIRERHPDIEVVLINKPDNVRASIAGMKAGAIDEIIVPFDITLLKRKIVEACKRRKAMHAKKNKKSLLDRFSDAMVSATFAQAGSYEDALDFMDGPSSRLKKDKSPVKKQNDKP
ncbi:MAG: hypothetical protein A2511_05935 [Deltaproteobacteria bacterium RIFOXYD12_FULL_50_9]|nr:MAG: hypothetical protein A2511_05935 [Deltaproteobacteria bacterium RIFOXYD12_FULL_50_9]